MSAGKIYSFGNEKDISDGTNMAQNSVVMKVLGNLTIKDGVTLTSVSGSEGGPKGIFVYCTGNIQNDGIVSMSGKGAYSEGQNVYLYENSNSTFEFIPKYGGKGGEGAYNYDKFASTKVPIVGESGKNRGTGGGSGGSACCGSANTLGSARGGHGGAGTSYSGGASGSAAFVNITWEYTVQAIDAKDDGKRVPAWTRVMLGDSNVVTGGPSGDYGGKRWWINSYDWGKCTRFR